MQVPEDLVEPGPDQECSMSTISLVLLSQDVAALSPPPAMDRASPDLSANAAVETRENPQDQGSTALEAIDGESCDIVDEPRPADPLPHSYVKISSPQAPRNIVFFGETGVGKSAIINMLREKSEERFDDAIATVSNRALGCTLTSTKYPCRMGDEVFVLWDTAGLVEGEFGNVTGFQAEENLINLLRTIEGGGVSLLVYCIRARRFRTIIKHHYDLFFEKTCEGRVPIVLVVTGLENEVRMEDWWVENAWEFETRGIVFSAHACITSNRGKRIPGEKGCMFDEEYEESSQILRGHIISCCEPLNIQIPAPKDTSWSAQLKHASKNWRGLPKKSSKSDQIEDDVSQSLYLTVGPAPPRNRMFDLGSHYSQGFGEMIPLNPFHHLL